MMRTDPTGHTLAIRPGGTSPTAWPVPPAGMPTAAGPTSARTSDGELVERCCDGLLIARRRRPLWTR